MPNGRIPTESTPEQTKRSNRSDRGALQTEGDSGGADLIHWMIALVNPCILRALQRFHRSEVRDTRAIIIDHAQSHIRRSVRGRSTTSQRVSWHGDIPCARWS